MMVMVANHTSMELGRMCGQYPGALGHLYSPGSQRGPWPWLPYALDNGAFPAFTNQRPWNEGAWLDLLAWAQQSGQSPRWVLVPDVVTNPTETIERWNAYAPTVRRMFPSVPLAFAAQDGHGIGDIPADCDVVFIGGSTDWKRQAIRPFCAAFGRVHVGRVNTYRWLRYCADAGAESCDGTGWFRGDAEQLAGLDRFLAEEAGRLPIHRQQTIPGVA